MLRRLVLILGLFTIALPLSAQLDTDDYRWDLADIAFSYPASWDEPFPVQRFGIESLILAESETRSADRAPEIPFIVFGLHPAIETDVTTILQEQITALDIQPDITIPATLLNQPAIWIQGNSRDDLFFGIGISIQWGDNILSIVGRSPSEQTLTFQYIFDVLIRSVLQGDEFGEYVPFGVVWNNSAEITDGDITFIDLSAIALDEPNQALYALDDTLGLLQFDLLSGRLESIIQNVEFVTPNSIAVSIDNTIYVGDSACSCIHVYQNDEWQDALTGFSSDAPMSILITSDGNLYASDYNGSLGFVRRFNTEGATNLFSEDPLEEQPILVVIDDILHLVNPSTGQLLEWDGSGFLSVGILDVESILQYIQVASDGTIVLAEGSTIDLITPDSLLIDTLDISDYSLGSSIRGFAIGSDDTLYIATVGEDVGEVLALSQRVADGNIGLQMLAPYRVSRGFLNEDNTEDIWIIDGTAGDTLSLFVQGYSELSDFQLGMSFIAPDGSEIFTFEEDTDTELSLSRGFQDYELSDTGYYEVHVYHLFSEGYYDITPVTIEQLALTSDVTTVWGELGDSHSQEIWSFEATAGAIVTITLEAGDPTQLDPYMSLYDSQFNLLEQNDDAEDPEFGNSAQIQQFTLSRNGLYYIDALRLNGAGKYSLTIDLR